MGIQINGQTDTISSTDGSLNIGGTVTVNVTGDATGLTGTPDITVGAVTASSATISGDLTVNGTTTTLDTTLTEVDKLEVGANNTTVGVAITQSGSGDILRLYDGATQVVTVKDGGSVGIGTDNPQRKLVVSDNGTEGLEFYPGDSVNGSTINAYNRATSGFTPFSLNALDYRFSPNGGSEALRITNTGNIGIGTDNPSQQKLTIDVKNSGTTQASFNGINIANTDSTTNNGSAIIFGQTIAGNSFARIGVINSDRTGSSEDQDIFFGTLGGGSYGERLRITSDGTLRQTGASNALGQGTSLTKLTHYTIDPTTPGGVGDVTTLETTSTTSNGSDYRFRITKREGSGGGSCYFDLGGNSDGSISFGTNTSGNGVERLRITHDGQVNISALDGTLRNPSLTNIQRNGLIIFPSSSNGYSDYSDNHMFSIAQSQGNWLSGETDTIHSSWGPLWTYHNGSGSYQKRAGIQYDHASSEQFKFWSSYGDIVFKTDNARSGNETAETCDTEALRIKYTGRVGIGTDNPDQKLEVNGAAKFTNGNDTEGAQMLVLPLADVVLTGNASASLSLGNRFTGMVVVSGYSNDTASGVWVVASASAYDTDTVSRLLFRTHPASNTTDLTITTTSVGATHQFQLNQTGTSAKRYKVIAFGIYG